MFQQYRDWVHEQYNHGITAALGLGWITQAADLGSKLLGVLALAIGIWCSLEKRNRDKQAHGMQMRLMQMKGWIPNRGDTKQP